MAKRLWDRQPFKEFNTAFGSNAVLCMKRMYGKGSVQLKAQ